MNRYGAILLLLTTPMFYLALAPFRGETCLQNTEEWRPRKGLFPQQIHYT